MKVVAAAAIVLSLGLSGCDRKGSPPSSAGSDRPGVHVDTERSPGGGTAVDVQVDPGEGVHVNVDGEKLRERIRDRRDNDPIERAP